MRLKRKTKKVSYLDSPLSYLSLNKDGKNKGKIRDKHCPKKYFFLKKKKSEM